MKLSDKMRTYAQDHAHIRTESGQPDPGAAVARASFVGDVQRLEDELEKVKATLELLSEVLNWAEAEIPYVGGIFRHGLRQGEDVDGSLARELEKHDRMLEAIRVYRKDHVT